MPKKKKLTFLTLEPKLGISLRETKKNQADWHFALAIYPLGDNRPTKVLALEHLIDVSNKSVVHVVLKLARI
jgi:hypothetical protein